MGTFLRARHRRERMTRGSWVPPNSPAGRAGSLHSQRLWKLLSRSNDHRALLTFISFLSLDVTSEIRRKRRQKSMSLNRLASKPTCHRLNSGAGWDVKSHLFAAVLLGVRICVGTCRRRRWKNLACVCTAGMCLLFDYKHVKWLVPAHPCTGVFNLSRSNMFLIKRGMDTWASKTIRFFFWKLAYGF